MTPTTGWIPLQAMGNQTNPSMISSMFSLRVLWICFIFIIALIGSFIPFYITQTSVADRGVGVCTAFTGSVCFALGTFLCQEGAFQLSKHWGESAAKLGPAMSIAAFLTMYCIDFVGKALRSFEPARRALATDRPTHLELITPHDPLIQQQLSIPLLSTDESQPSDSIVTRKKGERSRASSATPEGVKPKHFHHHRCESIAMGSHNLFAESLYTAAIATRRKHYDDNLSNYVQIDTQHRSLLVPDERSCMTKTEVTHQCQACCCDSDSDICPETASWNFPILSKVESNSLATVFSLPKTTAQFHLEGNKQNPSNRHYCGGHSCKPVANMSLGDVPMDVPESRPYVDLLATSPTIMNDYTNISPLSSLAPTILSRSDSNQPQGDSLLEQITVSSGSCFETPCVSLLLFLCFSFHSLVEGVGLGSSTEVRTIGAGIALHKGLAGFAVGTSLTEAGLNAFNFFVAVVVFSLMTPVGAILGLIVSSYNSDQAFAGIFTAIAGGTFLFISLNELIPKALKKQQDSVFKIAALLMGSILVIASEILPMS